MDADYPTKGVKLPCRSTIKTVNATRPNSGFNDFQHAFLRNVAATTGQSAEQVSWDYSQTNYSSARAATLEQECAEQGLDYEEVLDQRQMEVAMMKERGLPLPQWAVGAPTNAAASPPEKPAGR